MNAPLKAVDDATDLPALMSDLAQRARAAARVLALAPAQQKNDALSAMAYALRASSAKLLAANAEDVAEARASGASESFIDRLALTPARIETMAEGLDVVRGLDDPVGKVTEKWTRPNDMTIEHVSVPLGVAGVIFESRPNVLADAGALCLKSGNAVILRGGSDSFRSCQAIHACLVEGLRKAGLPEAAITLVPTRDRAAVGLLLSGLTGRIDVLVPRGGKSLDAREKPAVEEDWATEFEAPIIAAKVVGGLDEAIDHIEKYSSHHTDAIVTEDTQTATRFLNEVDSAIVLHNASTQFADGGEFGFGAEIGIATGKFHARGPVGVEQLTSFKYRVHGTGQTRP